MKNSFYIISLLVLLSVASATCAQSNDQQIEEILEEVSIINTATHLKQNKLDAEAYLKDQPDGGGELKGFTEGGLIRKISLWVGLSHGIEIKEYYFKNGRLIFVHEKFNSFMYDTENGALDLSKTEQTFEGRYFFKDRKLLGYETTGHNRFEDDTIDPEITLLNEARDYIKLLGRKP